MPFTEMVPARRLFEISDHPQQRGLAAARRPDEGDEVPVIHREVDALQGIHRPVRRREGEAQVTRIDHGLSRHKPSPGQFLLLAGS